MKQTPLFSTKRRGVPWSTVGRFLLLPMMFWAMGNLFSQTTWTGSLSTAWNTAENWSAGVPDAADDVTIPDVTNDPVISVAGTVAKSVTVESGALLTINAAVSLTINGSTAQGILNYGTVRNSGTITVGSTTNIELYGIYNRGTFTNNSGGVIHIDRTGFYGLYNHTGTFNNYATINIGSNATIGFYGIANAATFINNTGGVIKIDRSSSAGLYNLTGTFTNQAAIKIGSIASVGTYGIYNEATFNNDTNGAIEIDLSTVSGLYNFSTGTFINAASIKIGAIASIGGTYGIRNEATFNNNTGGAITIDRSTDTGLRNNSGTFNNYATITIGATSSVGNSGIRNSATFSNNASGIINIDRSYPYGLLNSGTFTNQAIITIGAIANTGHFGMVNEAIFNNIAGGAINIDRSADTGLNNSTGTFNNYATINIGANASVGNYGFYNSATFNNNTGGVIQIDSSSYTGLWANGGTFNNQASIIVGNTSNVGNYGILNQATFNNNTGGVIQIDRSTVRGIFHGGGTFTNQATIRIGASASVGDFGIVSGNPFSNNNGGVLQIDRSTNSGIYIYSGTFTNQATLAIGTNASVGTYGIRNEATFNNNTSGAIQVDNSSEIGLFNAAGTFANQAGITIGATANVGLYGIRNDATFNNNTGGAISIGRSGNTGLYNLTGTFTNQAAITIGASAYVGFYGILNHAPFNNTGGTINIDRSTIAGLRTGTNTFTNQGTVTIGALVSMTDLMTATSGTFSNSTGGTLKGTGNLPAPNFINAGGTLSPGYSPGKMTFTGSEDFSSSTMSMEVNGTGVAGTNFDQIVVNGTATLGGTLALNFNYSGSSGDVVIILSATAISGTFGTVTGRPVEWGITYTATEVKLVWLEVGERLPVELTSFRAKLLGSSVRLDWHTDSEINNLGFEVERSKDAQYWEVLGFVAGRGTTTAAQDYFFLDEDPLSPHIGGCMKACTNYYRLRQLDFDGKSEYSKVVSVEVGTEFSGIRLFPNPANGYVTLEVETNSIGDAILTLYSLTGNQMKQTAITLEGDARQFELDLFGIPAGMYLVVLTTDSDRWQQRLVLR